MPVFVDRVPGEKTAVKPMNQYTSASSTKAGKCRIAFIFNIPNTEDTRAESVSIAITLSRRRSKVCHRNCAYAVLMEALSMDLTKKAKAVPTVVLTSWLNLAFGTCERCKCQ